MAKVLYLLQRHDYALQDAIKNKGPKDPEYSVMKEKFDHTVQNKPEKNVCIDLRSITVVCIND